MRTFTLTRGFVVFSLSFLLALLLLPGLAFGKAPAQLDKEKGKSVVLAASGVRNPHEPKTLTLIPKGPIALDWERPFLMMKGVVGIPDLVGGRLEVLLPRVPVTVEAGVSVNGLIGNVLALAVKARPDATCWGCQGKSMFSIGFGVEANYILHSPKKDAMIVAGVVDMFYLYRFVEHFGLMAGLRGGLGLGWDIDKIGGLRKAPEFSMLAMLYMGIAF